jgi:hypothetical protein
VDALGDGIAGGAELAEEGEVRKLTWLWLPVGILSMLHFTFPLGLLLAQEPMWKWDGKNWVETNPPAAGVHNVPSITGAPSVIMSTPSAPTIICPKHGKAPYLAIYFGDFGEERVHYCSKCLRAVLDASLYGEVVAVK